MRRPMHYFIVRVIIGILLLSVTALTGQGQQQTATDAAKSAYDFDRLSGVIDADQVDYFSGNWSYVLPLGNVEGAGGMSLPIRMLYSSAVTGTDRLIKLGTAEQTSTLSKGTVTLNNATWVGLGWNLEFGAIRVTGGYDIKDLSSPVNHPFAFNLSLVLPDGSHRLVRQLDDSDGPATPGTPLPTTNVYYAENRRFMDIRWNFDRNEPLASTWTVKTISGLIYTFGAVTIGVDDYGMNQTVKGGAVLQGRFDELVPEMVYQWNLAEIRDQAGNTIRFTYAKDGPVTTVRDRNRERNTPTRTFRNLLEFADLDSRYPGGISVNGGTPDLTVVKTFNTAHLDTVILAGADGEVVRRITTETSAREDVHIPMRHGVVITYDNYFDTNPNDTLPYGHYLVGNNHSYRMYDGLSSTHRLDAVTVRDGDAAGSQIARFTFHYDDEKNGQVRPPVATGDNTRTLLLTGVGIMGTGNASRDNLPPYHFTNTLDDSYRITKIVAPTGGELGIVYEAIPVPDTTWAKHINYDEAFFDRSRRVKQRIWDADGAGTVPPDRTTFTYVQTSPVMDTVDSRRMRRITFPIVDETLPGGHGKVRREFVGESDLTALGLSATNRRHESERDIRRGLLEQTIHYDASGNVIQRHRTDWQVTTQGTWTGDWQWYYHRGMPQQAYWLRAGETTSTRDGVSVTTQLTHNENTGLVAGETLKSGSYTLRVTDTSYHADQVTHAPVEITLGSEALNSLTATGNHSAGTSPYHLVQAWVNADDNIESNGEYGYSTGSISVSNYAAVRLRGIFGTERVQGGDNMYASARLVVRWDVGGLREVHSFMQDIPSGGGLQSATEEAFDVLVPVPSAASTFRLYAHLQAQVNKPAQTVNRNIGVYAKDVRVTVLSADDPEDVFLEQAHILDRPHVVTVKDGSGTKLRSTRYRYGKFNDRIVMPDTTSVWLDSNGDGLVSSTEWIDRQVATAYDEYGNLTEARDAHGTIASTVMGYEKMRPIASFTGAAASKVDAVVFDDYAEGIDQAPGNWFTTGSGTAGVTGGALVVNDAVAQRNLPGNSSGVFEVDVMVDADDEQTAITLGKGRGAVRDLIRWVFDQDGTFKAQDGSTLAATGSGYTANQWYHLRIEWDGSGWWARVDGVRYPATGTYAQAEGGAINRVKLRNGSSTAGASFDNLRAWPAGAQPAAMTTFDPVSLDAIAVTDPNGHTTRFLRDGLRRVFQTVDGTGRVVAQRDHDFSREISGTSTYNTARPNRQTDIAYRSRDGHKDLSKDGHRIVARGTGDRFEEGVSLETGDPYVVASGETVDLRASVGIKLTTGFQADAGAEFRATLDPLAGGNQVTGTGGIAWNQQKAAKRSVKLGPDSALETGRVSGRVTARADFHPGSTSSGKTVIMAFEDGADHVRMVYENGSVKLESSIDGTAASSAFVPGYNRSWPWARVEMELLPSGTVTAWLYGHETTRFKGTSRSVTVPANWTPFFRAAGERGDGYIAGLYLGAAEAVTVSYDGLARQIQTKVAAGANDIVTQTEYNRVNLPETLLGPVHQSSSHAYGALTTAAAGSRVTTTTYDDDPLLRVSRVIPPGHTGSTAIDTRYGWGTASGPGRSYQTVDDEKGVLTTSVYDAFGRMQYAIADSAGASAATRNNRTSFAYDALDRLVSTTMPGGGASTYAYDTLGRMISRHHPDADAATLYKYDDLGRMRFSQDARQRALIPARVAFTVYDDFGRVTRVGEADATFSSLDPERSYAFERDSASWRSRMTYDDGSAAGGGPNYAQGRLVKVEENTDADAAAEVVHRYAYDHLGNVRVKKVTIDGLAGEKTITYAHDLAGRVTRLVYPDGAHTRHGAQARYAYDSAGRLSRVWDAHGNTLARYAYTAAGNVATHVVGDGIVTGTYTYNPREWVTGIDYAGAFFSTLTYDNVGNVTRQVYGHGAAASRTAAYAYDGLHRLTGFDLDAGAETREYEYDRNGNIGHMRTNGVTTKYEYREAAAPNRVSVVYGGGPFFRIEHNPNGWITRMGRSDLAYDYRGLLTGHRRAAYTMDPDRRRVKKKAGAATTYYLRGTGGSVLAEYDGSQALSARYVYAGTRRIARVAPDGGHSYYVADHLGSTRSLVDETGAVTAAYDYWPYGKILASSGTDATRFRFTGHERDESGLDYMLERSYAYDIGRFTRPDPMQVEYPGISPYAYAANNPLKYVDPDGRLLWKVVTKGLKVANRAYDAAKKGKSLLKKDTWKDIGTDELINFVDNVSTIADGVWDANDVFAIIDLATDQGDLAKRVAKGLRNPFKGKTPGQIDKMFRKKGFDPRGEDPRSGIGGYVNPKTGRSYHLDPKNRSGEPSHVDVNRSKQYRGQLKKKKYFTGE